MRVSQLRTGWLGSDGQWYTPPVDEDFDCETCRAFGMVVLESGVVVSRVRSAS